MKAPILYFAMRCGQIVLSGVLAVGCNSKVTTHEGKDGSGYVYDMNVELAKDPKEALKFEKFRDSGGFGIGPAKQKVSGTK